MSDHSGEKKKVNSGITRLDGNHKRNFGTCEINYSCEGSYFITSKLKNVWKICCRRKLVSNFLFRNLFFIPMYFTMSLKYRYVVTFFMHRNSILLRLFIKCFHFFQQNGTKKFFIEQYIIGLNTL